MRVTVLLLLLAPAVQAQPLVGPEVRLANVAMAETFRPPAPLAVAPARDGGFAFAWSASGIVHIARFDARGALIGTPREIRPTSPLSRLAGNASLASFGDGFLIGWSEDCGMNAPSCVWLRHVDAQLEPVAPDVPVATSTPLMVRSFGGHAAVAAGSVVWPVNADGSLAPAIDTGDPIESLAVNANGAIATLSSRVRPYTGCNLPGSCFQREQHWMTFIWFGAASYRRDFGDFLAQDAPLFKPSPAMASNGCCFLAVWSENAGGRLVASRIDAPAAARPAIDAPVPFAYALVPSHAAVASDGERYLTVWPLSSPAIGAAALDDGGAIELLAIPPSSIPITNAAVVAVARDRFVIVYGDDASAYARVVSFAKPPSHGRAVR